MENSRGGRSESPDRQLSPEGSSGSRFQTTSRNVSYRKTRVLDVPMQVWRKYGFVLLWAAVGLDLMISVMGHPYLGQTVSAIFVIIYLFDHVSIRRVVCSLWFAVIDIYFREISVGGSHKLESLKDGRGVIFAIAPHVNQFVDPIVVMKAVAEKTHRHVSFLTAAVSYQRKYIGAFARALKGIPVARPEDYEKTGKGFITTKGTFVEGYMETRFTKEFGKGSILTVKAKGRKLTGKIAQVIDDSHMVLASQMRMLPAAGKTGEHGDIFKRMLSIPFVVVILTGYSFVIYSLANVFIGPSWWPIVYSGTFHLGCLFTSLTYWALRDRSSEKTPKTMSVTAVTPEQLLPEESEASIGELVTVCFEVDVTDKSSYTVQPFVDQKDMFEQVFKSLIDGGTLGVFPEGGTHDGYRLLPLKWGIGTMVLGAMAKHQGPEPLKISVVPVGVNYFHPHKFRSTVSVDFGDPIEISPDLATQWKNGSKDEQQKATAAVMELIMSGVSACTLQARDMTTLENFRTLRRLMVDGRLSVADNVALTQNFGVIVFAQGIATQLRQKKDDPKVMDIMARCAQYNAMLHQYHVQDHQVQKLKEKAVSDIYIVFTTLWRLFTVAVFALFLLPYWIACAPTGLLLSVVSDLKAKQAGKMSVKGTWKILLGPVIFPLFHLECTAAFWASFGEFPGLVFFFFAPVFVTHALYAAEESGRVLNSVSVLLLLMRQKHTGLKLYEFREKLRMDVQAMKDEHGWLNCLDATTRQSLEARQALQWDSLQEQSQHGSEAKE